MVQMKIRPVASMDVHAVSYIPAFELLKLSLATDH